MNCNCYLPISFVACTSSKATKDFLKCFWRRDVNSLSDILTKNLLPSSGMSCTILENAISCSQAHLFVVNYLKNKWVCLNGLLGLFPLLCSNLKHSLDVIMYAFCMKNVAIYNSTCPILCWLEIGTYVTSIYSYCFKVKYTIQIIISYIMTYTLKWGLWKCCLFLFTNISSARLLMGIWEYFYDYIFLDKSLIARLDLVLPIAWMWIVACPSYEFNLQL